MRVWVKAFVSPACSDMLPSQKWRELGLASFLLLGLNFLYAANTQNVRHYDRDRGNRLAHCL